MEKVSAGLVVQLDVEPDTVGNVVVSAWPPDMAPGNLLGARVARMKNGKYLGL